VKLSLERAVPTAFVAFAVGYGLVACNVDDFLSGFFAGAAAVACYMIWEETIDDE